MSCASGGRSEAQTQDLRIVGGEQSREEIEQQGYPSRRFVQVHPNLGQNRMTYGARIGLVYTEVIGTDSRSIRSAIHEVLHTMGVDHPGAGLHVPGTGSASAATIMGPGCSQASGDRCAAAETLQPDDIKIIDTLFSAQSGGTYDFANNYELIAAVP